MSNQVPKQQSSSEEVDLGQLFQMIGNGFKKLFRFIGDIFKSLFNLFILFLLFLQKHFLKFAITILIGIIVGYFLDKNVTPKYISKMVVEPNFNSVQQLYNNLSFYNDLAIAKDSIALGEALAISAKDALTIKKFEVDSYSDENQKILLFDKFVRELDSTTIKALDFESYLKNFNALDARFHQISVTATNSYVVKRIQPAIIASISRNDYFKLQKKINDENLAFQDTIYKQQLAEIDSLQVLYKTVLIKEADKPMQGTNINLAGEGNSENKELAIIKERDNLKKSLVELNEERANKSSILNIISEFPARGVKVKGLLNSYLFLTPMVLFIIILSILILLDVNKYLKNYKKII